MSRYTDWLLCQETSFIKEVCGDSKPQPRFKDYCFRAVTLEELAELDTKHILNQAVLEN